MTATEALAGVLLLNAFAARLGMVLGRAAGEGAGIGRRVGAPPPPPAVEQLGAATLAVLGPAGMLLGFAVGYLLGYRSTRRERS